MDDKFDMNTPTVRIVMDVSYKKVYVWHTTEKQLDIAITNLLQRCRGIARSMQIGLDYSLRNNAISDREAEQVQTLIDRLFDFPKRTSERLKPLCGAEVSNKVALQLDVPKEFMALADVRNMLRDFEEDAKLYGNLGDFSLEYWVKPIVEEKYIRECNFRKKGDAHNVYDHENEV